MNPIMPAYTHEELQYDKKNKLLISRHKGSSINLKSFHRRCYQTLEKITQFKATEILVDNQEMGDMPAENQKWIQSVWFPLAYEAGLRKMAFVIPPSQEIRESIENANKGGQASGISIRYFEQVENAVQWLKEVD